MLTPEEVAEIRAKERRAAEIWRIRREELDRSLGFPYWPRSAFPALVIGAAIAGFPFVVVHAYFLTQQPRQIVVHVVQQP